MILNLHTAILLVFAYLMGPPRTWDEFARRERVAEAIEGVTDDPREARVLARIAVFESGLRRDIAACSCRRHECDDGTSLGLFQVQPRSQDEKKLVCGDYMDQARVALGRVRESMAMCRHLLDSDRLSAYTTGRCKANEPKARLRWGD